ncbi:MAG: hypothetical protein L0312_09920 [Acidobacteria bacterium]|nr:hypothetical protein [Acidobacteriota bacterium]
MANSAPYRVDGEVGRFSFRSYRLEQEGEVFFDSARDFFPGLQGEQWYLTRGFKEIALFHGTAQRSYRETTGAINRVRHVAEPTPMRSLREQSEREGAKLQAHIEQKSAGLLLAHGVQSAADGGVQGPSFGRKETKQKSAVAVAVAIEACAEEAEVRAEMSANPVPYEEPAQSVNVAVDDVGVKRQKAGRRKEGPVESEQVGNEEGESEEQKRVHTTVAHVETEQGVYVLSGLGVVAVLRQLLALLLANGLTPRALIIFVDGQRSLHLALAKVLRCWRSWQVILDWYHLEKRCRENLSLAMKGRQIRNEVLEKLLALLWDGRVESALAYLAGLPSEQIKNGVELEKLIGYLERQRPHIPCYSVRKQLGLRNSSNRGEKENDLVVAKRQKHNGMSWSPPGSIALAALATAARNEELDSWFRTGEIKFELAA